MIQQTSRCAPEQKKHCGTAETENQAVSYGSHDCTPDSEAVAAGIRLRDDWQKQHGYGIGDGGGKQDKRKAHTGQYTVDTQRLRIAQPVCHETVGNINRLHALQKIEHQTVGGEGDGKLQQLSHDAPICGDKRA